MANKSLSNIISQLKDAEDGVNEAKESLSELTPEEAETLEGGTDINIACGNKGCPTNPSCH